MPIQRLCSKPRRRSRFRRPSAGEDARSSTISSVAQPRSISRQPWWLWRHGRPRPCRRNQMRQPRLAYTLRFVRSRPMKSLTLIGLLSLFTAPTFAQSKDPVSDALRQILAGRAKNTIAAFEEMPADKYGFKPTPEQMTFGHLAAHVV